ncbi:MAG TPA: transglycosylase SLT domain-containing protein [Burkholderiaceae bacterium]|jgi:soluble lytic murein transglycosylase|nr:transglycosylase SLT domain-containing protein [Burkholderiaceae bacterium]
MRRFLSLIAAAIALTGAAAQAAQQSGHEQPAAGPAPAPVLLPADEAFLAARDAARNGDRDLLASLAPRVAGHLLEPYYEYWKTSLQAKTGEDDGTAVRAFLERYPGTWLSDRLRADWLLALGAHADYVTFQAQAREMIWNRDDEQIRCYAALAAYALDPGEHRDDLAREDRALLVAVGDAGGDGCTALAERLIDDGRLSIWERLRVLAGHGQIAAARTNLARLDEPTQVQLRQALDRPGEWLAAREHALDAAHREIALLAIAQLAREDPARAGALAERLDPALTSAQRGALWSRLGEIATMKLLPEALDWFRRAGPELAPEGGFSRAGETLGWQARAALRAPAGPDWSGLNSTLARMSPEQQHEAVWIYWDARARLARGDVAGAHQRFESIAGSFGFYPRLAAEEIGRPLELPAAPAPIKDEEISGMERRTGFVRALKLFRLGLRDEGNHEWSWQLRGMSDHELRAAAEYARRQGVLDRMIATSDRTRGEIDMQQRYPTPYQRTLSELAQSLGIDQAWIYGLIRQESRFVEDARSGSGAQGLMQLLPRTAGYVARRIGLQDYRPSRITEADVNLRLGVSYLKLVYDDQGAEPLLASAAYNAGPRRLRQWRGTLAAPMDGAVFVETIPLNETRNYVQRVLVNTMIYATLAGRTGVDLKSLLRPVSSNMPADTDLP